jgi:hypothetical protein
MLMATTGGIESEKVVAIFRITANLRLAGQGWLGQGWTELQLSSATAHLSRRCEELPRMLAAGVEDRDYRQSMFLLGPADRLGEAGDLSERERAGSMGLSQVKSCCSDHAAPLGQDAQSGRP